MKEVCNKLVIGCIVYSNYLEDGMRKLFEIEKVKNEKGIKTLIKKMNSDNPEIKFEDGEEWIVVKPCMSARGYKWRKAYVHSDITIRNLKRIIEPSGLFRLESYKIFD